MRAVSNRPFRRFNRINPNLAQFKVTRLPVSTMHRVHRLVVEIDPLEVAAAVEEAVAVPVGVVEVVVALRLVVEVSVSFESIVKILKNS